MINKEQVAHVARLARLDLSQEEQGSVREKLMSVLDYVATLENLDVSGVEPTSHGLDAATYRPDTRKPSFTTDEALAQAPERIGDGFGVPRTVD